MAQCNVTLTGYSLVRLHLRNLGQHGDRRQTEQADPSRRAATCAECSGASLHLPTGAPELTVINEALQLMSG